MWMPTELWWDESYSVGHVVLDNQHKKLLRACNELALCADEDSPSSNAEFHEILNDLSKYAREHFTTEEQILKDIEYPGLEAQVEEHFQYIEQLTRILTQATMGLLDKKGTLRFLLAWWKEHVLESDMQYKSFFTALHVNE